MKTLLALAIAVSVAGCGKASAQQKLKDTSYCVGFYMAELEKPINQRNVADIRKRYDLFVSLAMELLSKEGTVKTPSMVALEADPDLRARLLQGKTDWQQVLDAKQDDRFPLMLKFTDECDKLQSEKIGK
jgi:uncharacterized lipoprotein